MSLVYSLEEKIVLVTGSSSGIGKQIALRCSEAGSFTIITGRNEERLNAVYQNLNQEKRQKYISDLSDEVGISDLVSSLPQLDGIVLCAGMVNLIHAIVLRRFLKQILFLILHYFNIYFDIIK